MAVILFIGIIGENTALVIIGLVLGIANVIFQLIFFRCPYCRHFMGRISDRIKYCPFCGEKFED